MHTHTHVGAGTRKHMLTHTHTQLVHTYAQHTIYHSATARQGLSSAWHTAFIQFYITSIVKAFNNNESVLLLLLLLTIDGKPVFSDLES